MIIYGNPPFSKKTSLSPETRFCAAQNSAVMLLPGFPSTVLSEVVIVGCADVAMLNVGTVGLGIEIDLERFLVRQLTPLICEAPADVGGLAHYPVQAAGGAENFDHVNDQLGGQDDPERERRVRVLEPLPSADPQRL